MEIENSNAAIDKLAQHLAQDARAFFLEPFHFLWWLRGGEPGSPSDHLALAGDRGSVKATYIRARFDPARRPPVYSETFEGAIHYERASAILTQLFRGPLFRRHLAVEDESTMLDGAKETWEFRNASGRYSKTLHDPLPASIEGLRSECKEVSGEVVKVYGR